MKQRALKTSEQGFILATSLVMLVLLTMLSIATYYGTIISQQTSASAQESTQSFYYAETGLNYVAWALKNDAEFDGYSYPGRSLVPSYEPYSRQDRYGTVTLNAFVVGDRREWEANKGNPSNQQSIELVFNGLSAPYDSYTGQLGYFDNRDIYSRPVSLLGAVGTVSDIYSFGQPISPLFHDIYAQLSGYIRLDIDAYGQITPSFSPYGQHGNNTHLCNGQLVADVPCNGAIVWLTAGDPYTDHVLYPIDPYVAAPLTDVYGNPLAFSAGFSQPNSPNPIISNGCMTNIITCKPANPFPVAEDCSASIGSCASLSPYTYPYDPYSTQDIYSGAIQTKVKDLPSPAAYYKGLPCRISDFNLDVYSACTLPMDAAGHPTGGTGIWLGGASKYGLVVYAIGYSGGKARKMIRMVIN